MATSQHRSLAELETAFQAHPQDALTAQAFLRALEDAADARRFRTHLLALLRAVDGAPALVIALAQAAAACECLSDAEEAAQRPGDMRALPGARETLAVLLMRDLKPQRAEPLVAPLLKKCPPDKVSLLCALVEAYQAIGWHEQALAVIDACERQRLEPQQPELLGRYRALSEKHLDAGTTLPPQPGNLLFAKARIGAPAVPYFALKLLASALFAVALVVGVIWAARLFGPVTVYVVNGTAVPYECVINGQLLALDAGDVTTIRVRDFQNITVQVRKTSFAVPDQTLRIQQTSLMRMILGKVYVINPDHAAVLVQEQTRLRVPTKRQLRPEYALFTGLAWYSFTDIDFPFREFPEATLRAGKITDQRQSRLDLLREPDPAKLVALVSDNCGRAAARELAKLRLQYDPDNEAFIQAVLQLSRPYEGVEFLRTRLADRPVRGRWHELYQDQMRQAGVPDAVANLQAEYAGYVAKEPDSAALRLLLDRAGAGLKPR